MHKKVVCVRTYFVWCAAKKKKNTNKTRQFSGTYISETTGAISFKFGMYGRVYGQTKIC